MQENFNYKRLAEMAEEFSSPYAVTRSGPFWCLWARELFGVKDENESQEETWENVGWKIHISLSLAPGNIEKAWDLIVEFLMLYGVKACKVLDTTEEWPAFQWGKEITLYFHAEVVHWQELLDEITKKFIEAGVEPNYLALSDRAIEGSVFLLVATMKDSNGKYVDGLHCENFNPSNQLFPPGLERLKITHVHQPTKPVRKNEIELKKYYRNMRDTLQLVAHEIKRKLDLLSQEFAKITVGNPLWNLDDVAIENSCVEFSKLFRSTIISQIKEIRELHRLSCQDFGGLDMSEMINIRDNFFRRISAVEGAMTQLEKDIKSSRISPRAENEAQAIGEFNSGNVSSASSEGSPVKAASSEEASPRSTDDDRDTAVRSLQRK